MCELKKEGSRRIKPIIKTNDLFMDVNFTFWKCQRKNSSTLNDKPKYQIPPTSSNTKPDSSFVENVRRPTTLLIYP